MWKTIILSLFSIGLCACATTDEEIDHFGFAATTAFRDLNLTSVPIPDRLIDLAHPYGYTDQAGCAAWAAEIEALQTAITMNAGRRVGFRRDNRTFEGRSGNLRDEGVKAATTQFIPFRGVVRQMSGAAQLEQEAIKAADMARYRIGYLVGIARAEGCPDFQPRTVNPGPR